MCTLILVLVNSLVAVFLVPELPSVLLVSVLRVFLVCLPSSSLAALGTLALLLGLQHTVVLIGLSQPEPTLSIIPAAPDVKPVAGCRYSFERVSNPRDGS